MTDLNYDEHPTLDEWVADTYGIVAHMIENPDETPMDYRAAQEVGAQWVDAMRQWGINSEEMTPELIKGIFCGMATLVSITGGHPIANTLLISLTYLDATGMLALMEDLDDSETE